MDYGNAMCKAAEYRRKARAWERAAAAIAKAHDALAKAEDLDNSGSEKKIVKKIGNWD